MFDSVRLSAPARTRLASELGEPGGNFITRSGSQSSRVRRAPPPHHSSAHPKTPELVASASAAQGAVRRVIVTVVALVGAMDSTREVTRGAQEMSFRRAKVYDGAAIGHARAHIQIYVKRAN